MADPLDVLLSRALAARQPMLDPKREGALRLFNGFYEGRPELAVDLYGTTVVVHDHREMPPPEPGTQTPDPAPTSGSGELEIVERFVRSELPWVTSLLVKSRGAPDEASRRGTLRFGTELTRKVRENGVWYALDLQLNRDASLYLDTRSLRAWAKANLADARVLNTFAYTGSLGVAARAAPARRVVQTDLSRGFLNLAKVSYGLNGWPIDKPDFKTGDFFEVVGALKREDALFDCVFVDPPFFSTTEKGTVDLQGDASRLVNKVRPLVGDGGHLVAVNNALFVSGAEYQKQLEALCADGYLELAELLPVDADFTGFPETRVGAPPVDPAPFNHPTKIAVLRAKRKDGRKAR